MVAFSVIAEKKLIKYQLDYYTWICFNDIIKWVCKSAYKMEVIV